MTKLKNGETSGRPTRQLGRPPEPHRARHPGLLHGPRRGRTWLMRIVGTVAVWAALVMLVTVVVPPPAAVGLVGPQRMAVAPRFLADDSYLDASGERVVEQAIFDALFARIDAAQRLVHVDMFLFNDWQGPVPETERALSAELTDRLLRAAARPDGPAVVLVTDPINTVYGGLTSEHLQRLTAGGVNVVLGDLLPLQDSNPAWSSLWRWTMRPFGNDPDADTLPNPLGDGRVSVRSWLALANFKANHRKLALYDVPGSGGESDWRVMLTSANPHDASSAHRNVALEVGGEVVHDVIAAERALLELTGAHAALGTLDAHGPAPADIGRGVPDDALPIGADGANGANGADGADGASGQAGEAGLTGLAGSLDPAAPVVRLINESAIRDTLLAAFDTSGPGDAIALEMFYLAERALVEALADAARRGVEVRLLLDVNSDAFGRAKNGVPNRPVAAELVEAGATVRWCATLGEQCHAKWVHVRRGDRHDVWIGSGNLTRRNLGDYNLESDVVYSVAGAMAAADETLQTMLHRFERQWANEPSRTYSTDYATHADDRKALAWQYRFMEATGLGTF